MLDLYTNATQQTDRIVKHAPNACPNLGKALSALIHRISRKTFLEKLQFVKNTAVKPIRSNEVNLNPRSKGVARPHGINSDSVIFYCTDERINDYRDSTWSYSLKKEEYKGCFDDWTKELIVLNPGVTAFDSRDPTIIQLCPWWMEDWSQGGWSRYDGTIDSLHRYRRELLRGFAMTKLGGSNGNVKRGIWGGGTKRKPADSWGWSNCVAIKSSRNADTHAAWIISNFVHDIFYMYPDVNGNMHEEHNEHLPDYELPLSND